MNQWSNMFIVLLKMGKISMKILKAGKSLKGGLAVGSTATYSALLGWETGVMLMALLLLHELGHVTAMRLCGLKSKGIYFIPLLGAAMVPQDAFKTRQQEAIVAAGGPIFGLASVAVLYVSLSVTALPVIGQAIQLGLLLNFFNLLPIHPLDGGRILKSLAVSVNRKAGLGVVVLGALMGAYILTVGDHWVALGIVSIAFVGSVIGEWYAPLELWRSKTVEEKRRIDEDIVEYEETLTRMAADKVRVAFFSRKLDRCKANSEKQSRQLNNLIRQQRMRQGYGAMPLPLAVTCGVAYLSIMGLLWFIVGPMMMDSSIAASGETPIIDFGTRFLTGI